MPALLSASNRLFRTVNSANFFGKLFVAGHGANVVLPQTLFDDTSGGGENTYVQVQATKDIRRGAFMVFRGGSHVGDFYVPAGSICTRAYLRLRANLAWTGAMNDVSCVLLERDGGWNRAQADVSIGDGFEAELAVADCQIRDTGAAVIGDSNVVVTQAWEMNNGSLDSVSAGGQIIRTTAAGNLGACDLHLSRVGTATQTMTVRVYALDGTGGRPLTLLATSDGVAYNTLSAAGGGAIQTFTFSGGNQIALANATDYLFAVFATGTPRFRIHVRINAGAAYPRKVIGFGLNIGVSECNYIQHGNLPHLYEADDATIRNAPHSSISNTSFPEFTTDNDFYTVEPVDLHHQFSAWWADPAYVPADDTIISPEPNGRPAIHFAPTAATGLGITRQWDLAELYLSWRPPQRAHVSYGSVVGGRA